jgi:putative phage-type endonuclease
MIIEDVEQGSPDWIELRRSCVTGTEASIILGISHFQTMSDLYDQKIGLLQPDPPSAKMLLGQKLEPEARKVFNDILKLDCEPAVVRSQTHPWLLSSLDGISSDRKELVEIKCSEFYYNTAKIEYIPESNMLQMQIQMFCTELDHCNYFCYWKGNHILINVKRNNEILNEIIPKLHKFWLCVHNLELHECYNQDRFIKNECCF